MNKNVIQTDPKNQDTTLPLLVAEKWKFKLSESRIGAEDESEYS